jgi:hypothetical protein
VFRAVLAVRVLFQVFLALKFNMLEAEEAEGMECLMAQVVEAMALKGLLL